MSLLSVIWRKANTATLVCSRKTFDFIKYAVHRNKWLVGQRYMVISDPRSGSAFHFQVLKLLLGVEQRRSLHDPSVNGLRFEDLSIFMLRKSFISGYHFRATPGNIHLLNAFGITPIILVRNIFDAIISRSDRAPLSHPDATEGVIPLDVKDWPEERKIDFFIDIMLGWNISFYVSWLKAKNDNMIDCVIVSYEQMMADKVSHFKKLARFLGADPSDEEVVRAIEQVGDPKSGIDDHFFKGVVGRGKPAMTSEQIKRIEQKFSFYDGIDFSPLGIEK